MTEQQINAARYIKDNILPKLQETQRGLYFDKNILISVNSTSLYGGTSATLWVSRDTRDFSSETLCCKDFPFYTGENEKTLQRVLRGLGWFIKNWQERLG